MHTRRTQTTAPRARRGPSRRALGRTVTLAALAAAPLTLAALPSAAGAATGGTVNLIGYSTPKPAYGVLDADYAKTKAGAGVTISSSFGPSGTQATSVVDGL
ncbi:MAG TPA: hypothetical protein VGF87_10890, partial [Acidimicrobiales bacterium]